MHTRAFEQCVSGPPCDGAVHHTHTHTHTRTHTWTQPRTTHPATHTHTHVRIRVHVSIFHHNTQVWFLPCDACNHAQGGKGEKKNVKNNIQTARTHGVERAGRSLSVVETLSRRLGCAGSGFARGFRLPPKHRRLAPLGPATPPRRRHWERNFPSCSSATFSAPCAVAVGKETGTEGGCKVSDEDRGRHLGRGARGRGPQRERRGTGGCGAGEGSLSLGQATGSRKPCRGGGNKPAGRCTVRGRRLQQPRGP